MYVYVYIYIYIYIYLFMYDYIHTYTSILICTVSPGCLVVSPGACNQIVLSRRGEREQTNMFM